MLCSAGGVASPSPSLSTHRSFEGWKASRVPVLVVFGMTGALWPYQPISKARPGHLRSSPSCSCWRRRPGWPLFVLRRARRAAADLRTTGRAGSAPAASRLCPIALHAEVARHHDDPPRSSSCSARHFSPPASEPTRGSRTPPSSLAFSLLAKPDPLVLSALQRCPSAWPGSPKHVATVELRAIFAALVGLCSFVEPTLASPGILVQSSAAGFVVPLGLDRGRACLRFWLASALVRSTRGHCVRSEQPRLSSSLLRGRLVRLRWR